jgi:hypothetical protein
MPKSPPQVDFNLNNLVDLAQFGRAVHQTVHELTSASDEPRVLHVYANTVVRVTFEVVPYEPALLP